MKHSIAQLLGLATVLSAVSCTVDDRYSLDKMQNLDASVTLFGKGIDIPVGQTEQIKIKNLLGGDGEGSSSLDDLLEKDDKGNLGLSVEGSYNLDEELGELDLNDLASIDGVSHSESVSFSLGDYDLSDVKIDGQTHVYECEFGEFGIDDISIPSVASDPVEIDTKLRDFKIEASQLNMSSKLSTINRSNDLFPVSDVAAIVSGLSDNQEVGIPNLPVVELTEFTGASFSEKVALGNADQIADISNIKLKNGGKIKIEFELTKAFLSSGTVVPQVTLNLGSMFKIKGAAANGNIDLSSLTLTAANGWKNSATYEIADLAPGFVKFTGSDLSLSGNANISGTVRVDAPKSSKAMVQGLGTSDFMGIQARISFVDVEIESVDITLADNVDYEVDGGMNIPIQFSANLPEEISNVKNIKLDPSKPVRLSVSAKNIKSLTAADGKHLSIKPEIVLNFPAGIVAEGAVNGKLTISGDLSQGDIAKDIIITDIKPVCSNGKVSFDGNITATVNAKAGGTFSSNRIPATAADDILVTAVVTGQPEVLDFDLEVSGGKVTQKFNESTPIEFSMKDAGNIGTAIVTLKNSPAAVIEIKVPELNELSIEAENLKISLPDFLKLNGKDIKGVSASQYDEATNTITLNGRFPERITLPIKEMTIDTDKETIKGDVNIDGSVVAKAVSGAISSATLDNLKLGGISFKIIIPDMEADKIDLKDGISIDLDETYEFTILSADSMPDQISYIEKIEFEKAYLNICFETKEVPEVGSPIVMNAVLTLPEFFVPNAVELKDKVIKPNGTITVCVPLKELKDIDLNGGDIKGTISLTGKITADQPKIDLSTADLNLSAKLHASLGDTQDYTKAGKLAIKKASAKIDYSFDSKTDVAIDGLDDFRSDDNVFALNPELRLDVETNLGIPVEGTLVLTPSFQGKVIESGIVELNGIKLPYSDNSAKTSSKTIFIGKNQSAAPAGSDFIEKDLSRLLRTLPDNVSISIKASVDPDQVCAIEPSAKYVCKMDYKLNIPLSFGEGFNLGITKDIDLDESVSDIMDYGRIALKATVVNALPIGLDVMFLFLDEAGNTVPLAEQANVAIEPARSGSPVESKIAPVIGFKSGAQAVKVAKLRLDINVTATPDVQINEDDYLQIKDIVLSLPEGITINPKEL